jgi:hypothetical protein
VNASAITERSHFLRSKPISLKKASILTILLAALTWGTAAAQTEQEPQSQPPDSAYTSVDQLIDQGNIFASKYFDNRAALELYNRALTIESTNCDLLWHISQAYIDIGEHLPASTDDEKQQQLTMYEKALEFAEKSVTANASSSMAFTRRAIAVSHISRFRGFWETLGLLRDVRSDLERAVALDSANHLAFYTLGRIHMRVTERPWIFRWPFGLGWGSRNAALRFYERAIALKGDIVEYRMGYANGLIEAGEYEKARQQLLSIPNLPTMDEDDERLRREARELYDLIKDED